MLSSGRPVCNFGLAFKSKLQRWRRNRKEEVTFVDVECYGPRAEAIGRFFTEGEGRLKLDQWESKEGEKRSAIRVVLDNFEFVDSKQEAAGTGERQPMATVSTKADTTQTPPTESPNLSYQLDPDLDEDVPFKEILTLSPLQIMSTTEILLVEPIENLGSEGDIVKVRPGYARIFFHLKALPLIKQTKNSMHLRLHELQEKLTRFKVLRNCFQT